MASDAILRTYGDVSIKEDVVLNAVEILTARETQIMNMIGKTTAIATVHSFLVDTLRTAATAAVGEGEAYTVSAGSTPTRLTNLVEIIAVPYAVTRTQQEVQHYTGTDELARQTEKAMMDWANSAEFDVVRSAAVSGVSGTVPKMNKLSELLQKMYTWFLWQNQEYVLCVA